MAAGMLTPLNPLSRGFTDLSGGEPSVLDIAFKRKGIEMDLGKAAAAQKIENDKLKAEQQKAAAAQLEKLPQTAKLEHTEAFGKVYNDATTQLGNILNRTGGVVPAAGTDDWREWNRIIQNVAQIADNSTQLDTQRAKYLQLYSANPNAYRKGTREAIQAWGSVDDMLHGNLSDNPLIPNFDIMAYLAPHFAKIQPDQVATAGPSGDGGVYETTTKRVVRDDIKKVAEAAAADDIFYEAALEEFKNYSPEKQAYITKLKEDNGMTIPAAMALDLGVGLQEYEQRTANYQAPSESGAGRAMEEQGLNWLSTITGAMMRGDYEGLRAIDKEMFGVTPGSDGGDHYSTFKGWVMQPQTKTGGDGGNTKLPNNIIIKDMKFDRSGDGEVTIWLEDQDGNSKGRQVVSFEQYASEVIPRLAGYNKDKIKEGMGAYVASGEKAGHFKVNPSDALDLQQGGRQKPKGGALDIENAGELD